MGTQIFLLASQQIIIISMTAIIKDERVTCGKVSPDINNIEKYSTQNMWLLLLGHVTPKLDSNPHWNE